jgi:hypothetical protein
MTTQAGTVVKSLTHAFSRLHRNAETGEREFVSHRSTRMKHADNAKYPKELER